MRISCWLRRISLLVLAAVALPSSSLGQGPKSEAPPTQATAQIEEAHSESAQTDAAQTESAQADTDENSQDEPSWAVELLPQPFQSGSPRRRWDLPDLDTRSWSRTVATEAIRPDGSSLAEQASVVNSIPASSGGVRDTSMHAFYAIMAVLGLLAGGICCLQLSR